MIFYLRQLTRRSPFQTIASDPSLDLGYDPTVDRHRTDGNTFEGSLSDCRLSEFRALSQLSNTIHIPHDMSSLPR